MDTLQNDSTDVYSSNATFTVETAETHTLEWVLFVVEGGVLFVANMTIFLVIVRHFALSSEKHYLIMAGLSLADGMNGLAYLIGGVFRLLLERGDDYSATATVTRFSCALHLPTLLWVWADSLAALMLFVVAFDRLLAVAVPLRYLSWGRSYTMTLLGLAYGYCWVYGAVGLSFAYTGRDELVDPHCYIVSVTGKEWYSYYAFVNTLSPCLSIVCMACMVVLRRNIKRKIMQTKDNHDSATMRQQLERQQKWTVSILISGAFTIVFLIIPYVIGNILFIFGKSDTAQSMFFFIIANINPLSNCFIYIIRHNDIRKGFVALVTMKEMPFNVMYW